MHTAKRTFGKANLKWVGLGTIVVAIVNPVYVVTFMNPVYCLDYTFYVKMIFEVRICAFLYWLNAHRANRIVKLADLVCEWEHSKKKKKKTWKSDI